MTIIINIPLLLRGHTTIYIDSCPLFAHVAYLYVVSCCPYSAFKSQESWVTLHAYYVVHVSPCQYTMPCHVVPSHHFVHDALVTHVMPIRCHVKLCYVMSMRIFMCTYDVPSGYSLIHA